MSCFLKKYNQYMVGRKKFHAFHRNTSFNIDIWHSSTVCPIFDAVWEVGNFREDSPPELLIYYKGFYDYEEIEYTVWYLCSVIVALPVFSKQKHFLSIHSWLSVSLWNLPFLAYSSGQTENSMTQVWSRRSMDLKSTIEYLAYHWPSRQSYCYPVIFQNKPNFICLHSGD